MKEENKKVAKDKKKVVAIVGGAVASVAALVGIGALVKKRKQKNKDKVK